MDIPFREIERVLRWTTRKLSLQAVVPNATSRVVRRGQIYWCNFGENIGSEQCGDRPALVLQNDIANKHSPNTIVAPITNQENSLPTTTKLNRPDISGYVLLANIVTVSKARLGDHICHLTAREMRDVQKALYSALGVRGDWEKAAKRIERLEALVTQFKKQANDAQADLGSILSALGVASVSDAHVQIQVLKQEVS